MQYSNFIETTHFLCFQFEFNQKTRMLQNKALMPNSHAGR